MGKKYIKNNVIKTREEITITTRDSVIINPHKEEILADGWTIYEEPAPYVPTEEEKIENAKHRMLREIERYDKSSEVNGFILQGQTLWLDREMRRTVRERCEADLKDGITISNLSIGEFVFPVAPQRGLDMLHALDRYAIQCFDNTQVHIRKIKETTWQTEAEVLAYDYKAGYPTILNFDLLNI